MDKRAIQIERERTKYYKAARSVIRKALNSYLKDFEADLNKATTIQQMVQAAERPIKSAEIEQAIKRIYAVVGENFGKQTFKELTPGQKGLKFEPNVQGLVRPVSLSGEARSIQGLQGAIDKVNELNSDYWFRWAEKEVKGELGKRIVWITNTTRDSFINSVDRIGYQGFEDGKSIAQISKAIMKDLGFKEKYRAERIARTEVVSASNLASKAGAEATGLELNKVWIAYIDTETRQTHADLNGTAVDMNEEFSNGLDVPGDPNGEAEEVINCRCSVGFEAKKDTEYSWGREI